MISIGTIPSRYLGKSLGIINMPGGETRTPAVPSVTASDENTINQACRVFTEKNINTELVMGFEDTDTCFYRKRNERYSEYLRGSPNAGGCHA